MHKPESATCGNEGQLLAHWPHTACNTKNAIRAMGRNGAGVMQMNWIYESQEKKILRAPLKLNQAFDYKRKRVKIENNSHKLQNENIELTKSKRCIFNLLAFDSCL